MFCLQDTVSILLFNVMPQLIDILVACTYLAAALKGPWVAIIVLFTVGSYVPLTLLITEQRGKVRFIVFAS
jgi:ATP-binding cassette subfamily B (MDR/TAP) protein 6